MKRPYRVVHTYVGDMGGIVEVVLATTATEAAAWAAVDRRLAVRPDLALSVWREGRRICPKGRLYNGQRSRTAQGV